MTDVEGVLAIVRLRHHEPADEILDALTAGGVTRAEVTLPTPVRRRPGRSCGPGRGSR